MAAAEDLPRDLVFVDLETTGGNAAFDRITEVGLVRIADGRLVEEWSSLVNPERPIPSYIEAFTGISDAMVAGAPRFAEIAGLVRQKLQGALFVAHNARFDHSFLRGEFSRSQLEFAPKVLCTVKLSRRLFPEHARHNLDAVMERHGLNCSARHRALGDARVLHDLWFKLLREVPEPRLAAAVQAAIGSHKLPAHLPPGLVDEVPEGPGVYRFYGAEEQLLYVGRSDSLRMRVYRHFAAGDADSKDRRMADEVRRIDWLETAGELGALLREAEWLKAGKPRYNRRTKDSGQSHTLRVVDPQRSADRPCGVEAIGVDEVDPAELMQCYGMFHSDKDARKALRDIAAARQLCLKVLGLEEGAGSCLAYQLGKCRGACVGKEPMILHDTRLKLALSPLKLKPWPFPGRVALRERSRWGGAAEITHGADLHVVDHWTYLGTARTDEELAALGAGRAHAAFDADVYKILVRYFSKHPQIDWVDLRGAAASP
jgi:DNA polymerase-3 subunit epsilon